MFDDSFHLSFPDGLFPYGCHLRHCRLMEVLDKGKAAAVTTIVETRDKHTGQLMFENQSTVFIRGAGGFGGKRVGKGAVYVARPFGRFPI